MTFPTPYTVTRLPAGGLTEDADGNTVESFGDPVELPAYQWHPHIEETRTDTTVLETWDLDLYMPKTVIEVEDRVVIDGVAYDVVDVADWTKGFHRWEPGIVVGLRKWEG